MPPEKEENPSGRRIKKMDESKQGLRRKEDGDKRERVIPMNPAIKVVVALLVAALIAVIGMIMLTNQQASEQKAEAATTQATTVPQVTAEPQVKAEESTEPQEAAEQGETGVSEQAQDEAQEDMYEGALAGLSEEEIAKMALAEEQSHGAGEDESETDVGEEDAVD